MQFVIDATKVKAFREELHRRFPHWAGHVQIATNGGGHIIVAAVRGYKMTAAEIFAVMEAAERNTTEAEQTSVPAWQPVQRRAPRYSSQVRAANKIRLR